MSSISDSDANCNRASSGDVMRQAELYEERHKMSKDFIGHQQHFELCLEKYRQPMKIVQRGVTCPHPLVPVNYLSVTGHEPR